jgi:diguanylate cyclase (GGDEF)-like protein/PAS domain S-box-containing protein
VGETYTVDLAKGLVFDIPDLPEPAAPESDLTASSPIATLVYDLRHRAVRYVNRTMVELAGRPAATLIGRLVDDLLEPTESVLPGGEAVATSGAMRTGESLLRRPDGTTRHVDARTAPVTYDDEACGQVVLWDITERVRWEQQLLHRASHDTLTGLPNAWYASIFLHKALRQTGSRAPQYVAVLFVDLNGFKQINDTYGHHLGDVVLRQIAHRLKQVTSTADLTARLHGDEFLVVSKVANHIHGAHIQDRIRRALSRPIQAGNQKVAVSASVGIAMSAAGSADADRLLRFADHRMYAEKRHSPVGARRRTQTPAEVRTGAPDEPAVTSPESPEAPPAPAE